jgi:hypothetical protein
VGETDEHGARERFAQLLVHPADNRPIAGDVHEHGAARRRALSQLVVDQHRVVQAEALDQRVASGRRQPKRLHRLLAKQVRESVSGLARHTRQHHGPGAAEPGLSQHHFAQDPS